MPNRFTSKKTMLAAVVGALRRATGRGRITKTSGADVVIDCPSVKDGNRVKAALDRFGIMSMIGDTLKQRVVPYAINVMPAKKKGRRRNPSRAPAPMADDFAHLDSMGSRITRVIGPGRRPGTWRVEVSAVNFRDPPTVYTVKWSKPLGERRPRYPHFRVVAD